MITTQEYIDTMVEELVDTYLYKEKWHKSKLSKTESEKYFRHLLHNGNIITWHIDKFVGYVEFWKINYEQLGRIICDAPFSAYMENVQDGNIAYISDLWIHPDYRGSSVLKCLRLAFLTECYMCDYFIGEKRNKKTQPIKVFNRKSFLKQGEV